MTIGAPTEVVTSLVYLLPVIVAGAWWLHRRTSLAELAVWIPTAVALDVLVALVLSWAMPLDGALIVTRILWVAAGIWLLRRNHWRLPRPPETVTRGHVAIIVATALASFLLSASISRPGSIWDRQFHVPLVAMLRGQRLPFLTVFQSNTVLHFHFAGDVISAALQTFSLGRIHASLALALTHDLMFVLVGVSLAAWLTALAGRAAWIVPGVLAVFLSGPMALQRVGLGPVVAGYSYLNLLCMSYRPAISPTILLLVGAFAAIVLRVGRSRTSDLPLVLALLACMAVLGISDEPSAALLGVGMAALWIARPGALHPNRTLGFLLLVAGAAAIILPNLLFQAALVPGGPVQKLTLVPVPLARVRRGPPGPVHQEGALCPRHRSGAVPDDSRRLLRRRAWHDSRQRTRVDVGNGVLALVLTAILVAATLALTTIDVNGMPLENHRFVTVCEVVFPVAALVLLTRLPPARWERILLIGALLIPAISTWYWSEYGVGSPDDWFTNRVDCRAATGAGLFDKPRPTYIPKNSLYEFAGCRAVFVPGGANTNNWAGVLLNGYAAGGKGAFQMLNDTFVRPNENLRAACPVHPTEPDALCTYVESKGRCKASGARFRVCEVSPADRAALATQAW